MAIKFELVMNGKKATLQDAENAAVVFANAEDKVARIFSSQAEFRKWGAKSEHAAKFADMDRRVAAAKKLQNADNKVAIARQRSVVKRINKELDALANATGLEVNSEALFARATVKHHPLEGPIFDPAILYEHINRGGRPLPMAYGIAFPDFRWVGYNDIASSIIFNGYCSLWSNIWYTGIQRVFTTGTTGAVAFANFPPIGFNDVASSGIAY